MPTVPSEQPIHSHQYRKMAESFGSDPARYDRTRPHYPPAMVERILAVCPGPRVLDVGIGTGIAAGPFHAAGCRILGVEVDARMAEFARQRGHEVEVAKFEAWDPAGRTFDAVIAGQTWHWVDPVAGAAKAADVLHPGGVLAVFWNVGEPPAELRAASAEIYRKVLPDSLVARWVATKPDANAYTSMCDKAIEGIQATGRFAAPQQWQVDWEQPYTRDEWLDQMPTQGGHVEFSPAALAEVLAGTAAAIDAMGGSFTMRYTTVLVTATTSQKRAS
ncbi:class I SAM-dependent methyltransferase [Nocardia sp. NPDC049149]|uniref:class I SAM-dependent methyltransferase n=1 Tax=Nocardia sp. NPDC049149 TaxID=3364315 RepID=UPI00372454B4